MKKDILIIFAGILLIAVLIAGTEFQTVEEYYLTHLDDINSDSKTVTLSIKCTDAITSGLIDRSLIDNGYIPENGIILEETEYVLRDGDTVFDILYRAVRYERIQFEYQGADDNMFGSVYIQGISYLYEFDCGSTSGWLYKVNSGSPQYGISKYVPKDGDRIEIYYTCNYSLE